VHDGDTEKDRGDQINGGDRACHHRMMAQPRSE